MAYTSLKRRWKHVHLVLEFYSTLFRTILTILGGLSVIKLVIFIFLYFKEKERYINFTISYHNPNNDDIEQIKNAPIRYELDLYKIGNFGSNDFEEYFKIACPGRVIKGIRLMEYTNKDSWFSKKLKYNYLKKISIPNIRPDEFLLVKTIPFETIPAFKLACRVDGAKVEIHFSYNGLYGMHDKEYVNAKHDLYSFLYQFFRNSM